VPWGGGGLQEGL
jgi:hypothetical protein